MSGRKRYRLEWETHRIELGVDTCIMGIVNITPDSFSDGGRFFSPEAAVAQGLKLAREGAHILDIGGESTRPFSEPVPVDEEIGRVVPVIRSLSGQVSIPLSIDTNKAAVAREAIAAGASMINDISALGNDPEMGDVAAEYGVPVILMHMLGTPKTMQMAPEYEDLLSEVRLFLEAAMERAQKSGVDRSRLIVDPGIGFGKTVDHNLRLIRCLDAFGPLDVPILVGSSRKAFIRTLLKNNGKRDLSPDLPIVETGTQATVAAAILSGAHMVRVHDVAGTAATARIIDAMLSVDPCP
jgi:dihydropteroate synthase